MKGLARSIPCGLSAMRRTRVRLSHSNLRALIRMMSRTIIDRAGVAVRAGHPLRDAAARSLWPDGHMSSVVCHVQYERGGGHAWLPHSSRREEFFV